MSSQLTAYITLICTSGVLNLYLGAYVFAKRQQYKKIANFFIIYTSSITIYCFASAFSLTADTIGQLKLWNTLLYIGMPASAPLGLLFIMHYLGIKLTKKRIAAMLAIPAISFLMAATNDFHHLHYKVFEIDPSLGAPFVRQEIGSWYLIHGIYTFGCMLAAFLLVLFRWRETAKAYRPQIFALSIGQLIPMSTAFIYLIGMTPAGIDPVPMVICASSFLYLWVINRSQLFAVMPIAKDAIFNSMSDGVLVLNESLNLIEFNHSAEKMFPSLDESLFGMDFENVWKGLSGTAFPLEIKAAEPLQEIELEDGYSERVYQVRISPLRHGDDNKGLLAIFTDITELKSLQRKLEHQAYYDELTGIFNRRAFFRTCEQQFAEAKQTEAPFTVILIDIDHFKQVNDTFGHQVGDQLLKHVVDVCQAELKENMLFARYGGEEFVLALNGMNTEEGAVVAERLRRQVESNLLHIDKNPIAVTISSGIAEASAMHEETLYQLLNKADLALYVAKHEGRNQVKIHAAEQPA